MSGYRNRPSAAELEDFRNLVRRHIADHAPPIEAREGHRAPEDAEQEAEDFAALLIYRLGRLPSDRSSIVQVRLGEAFG